MSNNSKFNKKSKTKNFYKKNKQFLMRKENWIKESETLSQGKGQQLNMNLSYYVTNNYKKQSIPMEEAESTYMQIILMQATKATTKKYTMELTIGSKHTIK